MTAENDNVPGRLQAGDWFFRLAVPAYVCVGAVLKLLTGRPTQLPLVSLQHDPSPQLERFASAALPVVSAVELVLAGAIVLGGRWARWLAMAVLCVFAAVLIPHARAAAASCGCFGAVETSPTLMLVTAITGALLVALLPASGRPFWPRSPRWIVPWALLVSVAVTGVSLSGLPERLGWRVPLMRLRPETWEGKRLEDLPFYAMLEPDAAAERPAPGEGVQTWVLWLRTCPHCHEYFRERWSTPTTQRVVAVEIPPSAAGVEAEPHAIDCPSCVRLHLRKGTFYVLPRTPVVLTVRGGVVSVVDVNPALTAPTPTLDGP